MKSRAIERRVAVLACAGTFAAAVLAGSCAQIIGIEDLPPIDSGTSDFAVHGTAAGVLGPLALELRIDGDTELLAVDQDGTFAFATRLRTGASYTVVFVNPDIPCTLRNQTGMIANADTAIELTCTGASLASVVVSGIEPATIMLTPDTTAYQAELPLLQQSVTVTATVATPGDMVSIAGTSVPSGIASMPITLGLGDNPLDILVENDLGWQRTYRLTLRRTTQVAQYAYGKASNTGAADNFGASALSGDTLVIAASREDSGARGINGNQGSNSIPDSGAVYVFRRSGATWQQEAYIKASNPGERDEFGFNVALSGDTLAVGARYEDSANDSVSNSGAVYVFRRTGTTWQQEAYIKASNADTNDEFGISVALSGDTLAVGARFEDGASNAALDSGAVYVFRRTGTTWRQEAYLKGSNTAADDEFGISVALVGDTLVAGADGEDSGATGIDGSDDNNNEPGSGAVYVFRRIGEAWQQEAYVKASNTGQGDAFGRHVALAGDTLAVSARYEDSSARGVNGNQDDDSAENSGAVYVFHRTGTVWQQEAYLKASNTGANDEFALVSLSGDLLAVGAHGEDSAATGIDGDQNDNAARDNSGAVYVFRRTSTTWQQEAYLKASNTGAGDGFGGVELSGDTLAVTARDEASAATGINGNQDDNSAAGSGAVYIFH